MVFRYNPPTTPDEISRRLRVNSCLLHPSWLMRAELYRDMRGYNEKFVVAQDYEFLMRASSLGFKFANLPRYYVDYRVSKEGLSVKRRKLQLKARLRVQMEYFQFACWMSWWGVLKTLVLFVVPMKLVSSLKSRLPSYRNRRSI